MEIFVKHLNFQTQTFLRTLAINVTHSAKLASIANQVISSDVAWHIGIEKALSDKS